MAEWAGCVIFAKTEKVMSIHTDRECNLDPDNWLDLRRLGHQMVDDMMDYLQNVSDRPVWTKTPDETKMLTKAGLPREGRPAVDIYRDFRQHILPYTKGNIHPAFFSWVQGTGTPLGALADFLASVMNPNVAIGDHAAMYVDAQVIQWCKSLFDFPPQASGMLVSGGSLANITALTVARNSFDERIREQGVFALSGPLVFYASTETHSCQQKAAEVLGLGRNGLRLVPVDENFRMDLRILETMLEEDRRAGKLPFCIVGNAGTVNTGAIDPLADLLAIARREKLWFHVDGAFGALAYLVDEYRSVLKAVSEADSLAFDLHKWMYMPYEVGVALIRDKRLHRAAFALQPTYLLSHERGLAAGPDPITNYGLELSRGFKALKVWMSLQEHGLDKYTRLIEQNIHQARYLETRIRKEPELELMAEVPLNIVCFRYNPGQLNNQAIDQFNKSILMDLHESGIAAPSYTLIRGHYCIRVCIVNHRTQRRHLDRMVDKILELGKGMSEK